MRRTSLGLRNRGCQIRTTCPRSSSSAAAAAVPELSQEQQRNLQELDSRGFTVVHDVFTPQQVQVLQQDYTQLLAKATAFMDSTPARVRAMEENDTQIESRYWKKAAAGGANGSASANANANAEQEDEEILILQAGKGRYDLYKGFGTAADGVFGSAAVLHNPVIGALVKRLLVRDYTSYTGVIHSTCGSEDQYWHRDTDNLSNSNTDGAEMVQIDDFYFTCLVPCTVPITAANGPTEFYAGSHRVPASAFPQCTVESVGEIPLGSALLFNGKCNHRGVANRSKQDRPAIYSVFHKLWYNDQFRKGIE